MRERGGARRLSDEQGQVALDLGFPARSAPGDDDLRFGREQDVRPVAPGAQAGVLGEDLRLALAPAAALADVNDRGRGREYDEAHEYGQADRAVGIDPRGDLRDHGVSRMRRMRAARELRGR